MLYSTSCLIFFCRANSYMNLLQAEKQSKWMNTERQLDAVITSQSTTSKFDKIELTSAVRSIRRHHKDWRSAPLLFMYHILRTHNRLDHAISHTQHQSNERTGIFHLANEMLDEITSYLPKSSQTVLSQTCHKFHAVATRLLYKNIKVNGRQARRLCVTLMSRNISPAARYVDLIRSFAYQSQTTFDLYLSYPLLCDALMEMQGLQSLELQVPRSISAFLLTLMNRKHIFREKVEVQMFQDSYIGHGNNFHSWNVLPSVRMIKIGGDIRTLNVVQHRSITSVTLLEELTLDDAKSVIEILTRSHPLRVNRSIHTLDIGVLSPEVKDYLRLLYQLSVAFPNLHHLDYRAPLINVMVCFLKLFAPSLHLISSIECIPISCREP